MNRSYLLFESQIAMRYEKIPGLSVSDEYDFVGVSNVHVCGDNLTCKMLHVTWKCYVITILVS